MWGSMLLLLVKEGEEEEEEEGIRDEMKLWKKCVLGSLFAFGHCSRLLCATIL